MQRCSSLHCESKAAAWLERCFTLLKRSVPLSRNDERSALTSAQLYGAPTALGLFVQLAVCNTLGIQAKQALLSPVAAQIELGPARGSEDRFVYV